MKLLKSRHIGLLALQFGVVLLPAQILVPMQNQGTFGGNDIRNLRVLNQSADGSEVTLTMEYSYNGASGSSARLFPVIANKSQQKVSSWFGADPVTIPTGHGTISIKVKFFNDEPGAPKELTTDRVRIMMLTDSGGSVIAQNIFSRTIKWGSPSGQRAETAEEARAREGAEAKRIEEEKAKLDAEAKTREEARLKAEQEKLAVEAKAKAEAEATAAEEARLKAEQEKLAVEAKAKAEAEAKALEEARLKAEQEEQAAEAKAKAAAAALEEARLKAEQERLAAAAKAKAEAEVKAREEARLQAEQERLAADAKAKAEAEAKAAEQARIKAEQEKLVTEAKAKAEAEAKAVAEARLKGEQERLAADAKAKADVEAKARDEAHLKAEQERLTAEAKAKADAEAKALEEARLKAEQERLAAEAKATAAAQALEAARLKAEQERLAAEARAKAEAETKARVSQPPLGATTPSFVLASKFRTKVSNVDIFSRSLDRSEMTISVDYDFSKEDGRPKMGVDMVSTDDPSVSGYFSSPVMDVGRGSHNSILFPVKLGAAAADAFRRATLPTDKIWVYLVGASGVKSYIFQGTMVLLWHVPGGAKAAPAAAAAPQSTVQIESFKQNDLFGGYVIVKYNLPADGGRLHLRVFDSSNPSTADWFASNDVSLKSGPGMQLVKISVPPDGKSPDVFKADTLEIQMLDEKGNILATGRKEAPMTWARQK